MATLGAALVLALPATAGAVSHKIAIGDFKWSQPVVHVATGEHVTWFFIGPDTEHSITGLSENARQWDSDPGPDVANHPIGDRFKLQFDQPGTYEFHCKLHAIVRGTVVVDSAPGNTTLDPDPNPLNVLDRRAPTISGIGFSRSKLPARGGKLLFSLDERASVEVSLDRIVGAGSRYIGFKTFDGFVGWNYQRFPGKFRGRALPAGRYLATVRAIDNAGNATAEHTREFRLS